MGLAQPRVKALAASLGRLDRVQREPVRVMRHDRVVGVMVSAEDYEAMRRFYADRLRQTLRETAEGAAAAGLTEEKLAELLADES